MLSWQLVHQLCDVTSLGSATNRAFLLELTALASYPNILAIYKLDPVGDLARQFFSHFKCLSLMPPPTNDISDFFRSGHDLKLWLSTQKIFYLHSLAPLLS